jgi:peptidyl-tRNA hydrolase, PTH1 family
MKLIVGLGNPGEKYEKTRHNLGFMVVDQFLKDITESRETKWSHDAKVKSDVAAFEWPEPTKKVIVAKPRTYMNNSGMAVRLLMDYYKIEPEDIWIVHDELDIPTGGMKIRIGGSSAGHNGIESIMTSIGTEKFYRFRLGIGMSRNKAELGRHVMLRADEYVLDTFSTGDMGKIRELIKRASKALTCGLTDGIDVAMNKYNSK